MVAWGGLSDYLFLKHLALLKHNFVFIKVKVHDMVRSVFYGSPCLCTIRLCPGREHRVWCVATTRPASFWTCGKGEGAALWSATTSAPAAAGRVLSPGCPTSGRTCRRSCTAASTQATRRCVAAITKSDRPCLARDTSLRPQVCRLKNGNNS